MELLYVWIRKEHGEGLKEYNFNFSKEYDIEYNSKKKKMSLTKESRLNIFSDNRDKGGINEVYALIGKNGSGKSTLLKTFLEFNYFKKPKEIIWLFKNKGGEYKIYNPFKNKTNGVSIEVEEIKVNKVYEIGSEEFRSELAPIYYNPHLGKYLTDAGVAGDISYERRFSNKVFKDIWSEDMKRVYQMFHRIKEQKDLNDVNNIITGKPNDKSELLKEIKIYSIVNDKMSKIHNLENWFNNTDTDIINGFEQNIKKNILLGIMHFNKLLDNESYKVKISEATNFSDINIEKLVKQIRENADKIEVNKENNKIVLNLKNRVKDFFDFGEIMDLLNDLKGNSSKAKFKNGKVFPAFSLTLDKILNKDGIWSRFIDLVSKEYIVIETGFSDGEWSMLKLFANLYNEINKKSNENKSEFLIILDEGDMGFHPEWQRKYLNIMIDFFNKIFMGKKINLIVASHSPFIASDLPKENVIFMGHDDNPNLKTFGANIHELYKESFFMGSTMGEFALNKIKKVIEDLTTLEHFKRELGIDCFNSLLENINDGDFKEHFMRCKISKEKNIPTEVIDKIILMLQRKDSSKYVIDQIGERVLSRKLGEKYREIFREKESEENKLYKQWKSLSKEKQIELLTKEFGGQ